MDFDPKKYVIKLAGDRLYLPVSARLIWFRQEHPDWGIETRALVLDTEKQVAVFEAFVYDAGGRLMSKGTKMEDVRGFPDYIEKAETGAIGRALAVCGFGTQFAPELDELSAGRFVDAPQDARIGQSDHKNDVKSERSNQDNRANSSARNGEKSKSDNATAVANTHASASSASSSSQASTVHNCQSCGKEVTPSQVIYSERMYQAALCPTCQKERKASDV